MDLPRRIQWSGMAQVLERPLSQRKVHAVFDVADREVLGRIVVALHDNRSHGLNAYPNIEPWCEHTGCPQELVMPALLPFSGSLGRGIDAIRDIEDSLEIV